ncbi:MAG TPA: OmpH family outer membrane protein [Verrucomicrobiae bacterium]|nr:OmpH family outer membrane protein [Verrucomicrobiae bacterium]
MKRTVKIIALTCAVGLLLAAAPAYADGQIATVDLKKLFDGYWKTKQADAALKARGADLEKEFKGMMADYDKATDAYKALMAASTDQAMSEAERDKKKHEAEDKLRDLNDQKENMAKFKAQANSTIDEQRRRMRDNILAEIRKAVDSKSKSAGYSLVIDVAAETVNNTPVVLFNKGDNDITDGILSQLNASAPPEASKPADDAAAPKK